MNKIIIALVSIFVLVLTMVGETFAEDKHYYGKCDIKFNEDPCFPYYFCTRKSDDIYKGRGYYKNQYNSPKVKYIFESFYVNDAFKQVLLESYGGPKFAYETIDGEVGIFQDTDNGSQGLIDPIIIDFLFDKLDSSKFGCLKKEQNPKIMELRVPPKTGEFSKLFKPEKFQAEVYDLSLEPLFCKLPVEGNRSNDDQRCFNINKTKIFTPSTKLKDENKEFCASAMLNVKYDWFDNVIELMEKNDWELISTNIIDRKNHYTHRNLKNPFLINGNEYFYKLQNKDFFAEISFVNDEFRSFNKIKIDAILNIYQKERKTYKKHKSKNNSKMLEAKPRCPDFKTYHFFGDYSKFLKKIS